MLLGSVEEPQCHRPSLKSESKGELLQFLFREGQRMGEGCKAKSLWV